VTGGDVAAMVFALAWVLLELFLPGLMRTRRPAARTGSGGRMAQRPYVPPVARSAADRW
jgi:hypothetical protein